MPIAWWLCGTVLAGGPASGWSVEPASIRFNEDGGALLVEVTLSGDARDERTDPAFVGVTVVTESGAEHDLVVHTVFPSDESEPETLLFSTEVPESPKYVLIGAWGERVEPCDVDRPGCREFGFVLNESLASFPRGLYTDQIRQRLLPASYRIGVVGDREAVEQAASPFAEIFGSTLEVRRARGLKPAAGVWVRSTDDLAFARELAERLDLEAGHDADLRDPMVVIRD